MLDLTMKYDKKNVLKNTRTIAKWHTKEEPFYELYK